MPIEPDLPLAAAPLDTLRTDSGDGTGVTRDTYGAGEQRAHATLAAAARALGLEMRTDPAMNLYVTLPGRDRAAPVRMTGSHLEFDAGPARHVRCLYLKPVTA
ncbi:MAG: hypothetical protein ACRYHA_26750 [Janthinobacterium lividum]